MSEKDEHTAMDDRTAPMPSQARPVSLGPKGVDVEATVNREPASDTSAREGTAVQAAPERPRSGSFDDEVERRQAPPARPAVGYTATFAAPAIVGPGATAENPPTVPSAPAPVDVFASRHSFVGEGADQPTLPPSVLAPPDGAVDDDTNVAAVAPASAAPPPATEPILEQIVTAPMALTALTALRVQATRSEPQGGSVHHPMTEEAPPAQPRSTDPWMPAVVLPAPPPEPPTTGTVVEPAPTVAVLRPVEAAVSFADGARADADTTAARTADIRGDDARGTATLELPAQESPPAAHEPRTLPLTEVMPAATSTMEAADLPAAALPAATTQEAPPLPSAVSPDGPTRQRAAPPPAPVRRRSMLPAVGALVACAALGAALVVVITGGDDDAEAAPHAAPALPTTDPAAPPATPPVAPAAPPAIPEAAPAPLPPAIPEAAPAPPPPAVPEATPAPAATPPAPAPAPPPGPPEVALPPVAALPPPPPPEVDPAPPKAAPPGPPVRAPDGFGPFLDRAGGAPGLGRALGAGVRVALGDALANSAVGVRGEVQRARVKFGRANVECAMVVFDGRRQRATIRGSASIDAQGAAAAEVLPRAAEACARAVEGELKAAVALAKGDG